MTIENTTVKDIIAHPAAESIISSFRSRQNGANGMRRTDPVIVLYVVTLRGECRSRNGLDRIV